MEENKNELVVKEDNYSLSDFSNLGGNTNTKTEVFTNIKDEKKLFNVENNVNYLLNDCEGETIRVKEILIKRYDKPLKEPIVDEETGEILKTSEITMSCVLIDDNNLSYATGSKTFTIQLMRYLQMRSRMKKDTEADNEIIEMKIIKKRVGEKGNKALSFELV